MFGTGAKAPLGSALLSLFAPIRFLTVLLFLVGFPLAACAPKIKPVEVPEYKGTLSSFLNENSFWEGLSGSFSLVLKKPDGQVLSADAFIQAGPEKLEMRFYRFGFPAGELVEEPDPRYEHLKEAIKNALIWWRVGDYRAASLENEYLLEADSRSLVLDRKTLVPLNQSLFLPEGTVTISYSAYQRLETLWYPFRMEIRYSGYELDLAAKKLELRSR